MRQVVVVTSSSGMDYLDKPDNIRILRFNIEINDEIFKDGENLSFNDITSLMREDPSIRPITSPPTTEETIEFFEELYQEGFQEVFMLCISSAMSDTYQRIHEIKSLFAERLFIHVFDSKTYAYAEARLALTVSKMITEKHNTLEIAKKIEVMCENNSSWLTLSDLTNMVNNGRISGTKGLMASMFQTKPILSINAEGEMYTITTARSINTAIEKMCEIAAVELNRRPGKMFIINLGEESLIPIIKETLEQYELNDLPVFPTSSTAVANHGPYGIGIGIFHEC